MFIQQLEESVHLGDLRVDGRLILKLKLGKFDVNF